MNRKTLPHYLRTVRALALVSGAAGVTVVACSSSPSAVPPGAAGGPEDAGADVAPGDAAPIGPDGIGYAPEDAAVETDAGPEDAASDVFVLGIGPAPGIGEGGVK